MSSSPIPIRRVAILAVGQELLGPDRLDTNSLWLAGRLEERGLHLSEKQVAGDRQEEIEARLADLLARHDLVVVTGGLGPTVDDRTKEAAAALLGRPFVRDEELLARLRDRFAKRGIAMPSINEKQADLIEGAHVLGNPRGTAPGFLVEAGHKVLVLLPGVPSEMKPMWDEKAVPHLVHRMPAHGLRRRTVRVASLPESVVDEAAKPVYARWPGIEFTILASPGEIVLRFAVAKPAGEAEAILDAIEQDLRGVLGPAVYGRDEETLESRVVALLAGRGETLAVAESCTGGWIGRRITDVPGASRVFTGGLVVYANSAKVALAGVPPGTLERHGAVSAETALALASGARAALSTDWGIGVTGIAGPDGGTPEKPVGTIHVAVAGPGGAEERRYTVPGDRAMVRSFAAQAALDRLRLALESLRPS